MLVIDIIIIPFLGTFRSLPGYATTRNGLSNIHDEHI